MRKLLLAVCTATAAVSFAATTAEYQWVKPFNIDTTNKQSSVDAVAAGPQGTSFVGMSFGQATEATWGDTSVIPSGTTVTTAYQRSWTIALADNNTGDLRWFVTSADANILSNSLHLAATPDGGVVMIANATFNAAGAGAPTLMTFTDTKGTQHTLTLDNTPEAKSPYAGIAAKFDSEGACQWTRVVGADGYETAGAFDANVVNFTAVAVDAAGNTYIGGVYRTALLLGDNLESRFAINVGVRKNEKTYNNGDAFILRLDTEGQPDAMLTSTSAVPYASKESLAALTVEDNSLYTCLIVDAAENLKYNLFNVETEISSEYNANIVYGRIDLSTFTCTEAAALIAAPTEVQPSHNALLKNIQVEGDRIYISGCQTGALQQDGNTITEAATKSLENFSVAIDTATFNAVGSYTSGETSIGYDFNVIRDTEAARVYTVSAQLTGTFCYLYEYTEDGTLQDKTVLAVGTNNLNPALFDNNTKQLLVPMYAKSLTSFPGSDYTTDTYAGFRGFLVSYKLPDVSLSGINTVDTDTTTADAPVEYYSLQGIRLANPQPGTLVIRRQGAAADKHIIR